MPHTCSLSPQPELRIRRSGRSGAAKFIAEFPVYQEKFEAIKNISLAFSTVSHLKVVSSSFLALWCGFCCGKSHRIEVTHLHHPNAFRLTCHRFALVSLLAGPLTFQSAAHAQTLRATPRPLITQNIDEANLVTLHGNTRSEANAVNDRGRVDDDFSMNHMLLQLQRSPEQEQALGQLIDSMHDRNSPNYQKWLTATEFGKQFGLAQGDLTTITNWLQSRGFAVNVVYPNGMLIDFSGTAGQVRDAFHTEIHHLSVNGTQHIANISDPQI